MPSTLDSICQPPLDYFATDYFTARDRFTELASALGARMDSYAIEARGPDAETLSIDTAYVGAASPLQLLIVSSAVHGAEGFAGSALQQRFVGELADATSLPENSGILLVHAINPYGFAHLRRANENNVDLNRNGLASFPGPANPAYHAFDALLNPRSPPCNDLFVPRLLWHGLSLGPSKSRQAIAGGQYAFPKGLFYGGENRQQSIAVFERILRNPRYSRVAAALHIDLHTGLGRYGTYKLFSQVAEASPAYRELQAWFGTDAIVGSSSTSSAYIASGLIGSITQTVFSRARVYSATLEFGTYPLLRVLASLRNENRLHHHGSIDSPTGRKIKAQFLETFCPADPGWRRAILEHGARVLRQAMNAILTPSGKHNNVGVVVHTRSDKQCQI